MRAFRLHVCGALLMMALGAAPTWGHTFPTRSIPKVGEVVTASPQHVRIWFDGALDPASSTLRVYDANGRQVDTGDGHVDPSASTLLEVTLFPLKPGVYRVAWSVVSRDGHATNGEYTFRLK